MNRQLLILLIGILFSSCAGILNNGAQKISIVTDKRIKVISVDSSLKIFGEENSFYVVRGRNPLKVNLQVDSSQKTILIRSRSSVAYWANIYFNYGFGLLVDRDSPKRYAYPRNIYLEHRDTNIIVSHFPPLKKGALNLHIAWPVVNFFHLKSFDGYRSSGGFLGLETGLDYFCKDDHFLSLYAGAASEFSIPDKVLRYEGEYQSSITTYINARNNFNAGCFNWGYGLNASEFILRKTVFDTVSSITQTRHRMSAGLSFMASYRFGNFFHLGLLYQPTLLDLNSKLTPDYQQYIFIELMWKIQIRRVANNNLR